ncbi:zinc finger CCCH-type with G patch domain-containing protein-like [Agrilus planipennis]|uniref:Zinc finger CCCH-type with G patch domain-containing protein-like n=1 Tax=Agrilus planipennis TaxID=224129 RepID=A0A7F5R748_AGRPL|nr:zinc finger CCCH-type with G patch domain-containing protein-like [Agrilus planipennis]
MEEQSLRDSLNTYKKQLVQVNLAISTFEDGKDKEDLFSLKNNLEQLIQLTKESFQQLENLTASTSSSSDTSTSFDCEYALFMSEMEKDGVLLESNETSSSKILNIEDELKAIEGDLGNDFIIIYRALTLGIRISNSLKHDGIL